MDESKINVMINNMPGDFIFSPQFRQYLKEHVSDIQVEYPHLSKQEMCDRIDNCGYHIDFRWSQVIIQLAQSFGLFKFSDKYSHIVIERIPAFMKDFIIIKEYDGSESIEFDWNTYWEHLMKQDISADQKVACMNTFHTAVNEFKYGVPAELEFIGNASATINIVE